MMDLNVLASRHGTGLNDPQIAVTSEPELLVANETSEGVEL